MAGRRAAGDGLGAVARLVVLAGLLAFTVGVYVVVVLGGGAVAGRPDQPGLGLSVLATAIVALGIEPVRRGLEATVARESRTSASPYDVLRRFSEDVTGSGTASDVPGADGSLVLQGGRDRVEAVGGTLHERRSGGRVTVEARLTAAQPTALVQAAASRTGPSSDLVT